MHKILKIIGIVVGSIVAIAALAFAAAYFSSESRLNRSYSVDPGSVSISSDAEVIAEGRRLASIRGCTDCHGTNLGGAVMLDDPAIGTIYASNLTGGEGGVAQSYDDIDFLRAIRHGVDSQGKGLLIMPSAEYYVLSDADTGALIAFINSLPAVDRVHPEPVIGPLGRLLFTLGQLPPLAAEIIDHEASHPVAPEASVSTEFGAYLATSCMGCHGANFAGGPVPGSPPDAPEAANLTPAGNPGNWNQQDFLTAMRTGVTPEGKTLDPGVMPWPIANAMTETELEALWLYLRNLEPVE